MNPRSRGLSTSLSASDSAPEKLVVDSSPGTVQAVQRSLRLLLVLAQAPRPRTLQELSVIMGCSISTVHRMLSTLGDFHLVEKEPVSRRYRLGPAVFHLASARSKQTDLREVARRHLEMISDASLETVSLSMRVNLHLITLDTVESVQDLRLVGAVGTTIPLRELGAGCKAVLAFLPRAEQERVLDEVRWERVPYTPSTLREELQQIRTLGIARSYGERLPVAASMAAPLLDSRGDVVGAIAVAGPNGRWTSSAMDGVEPLLRTATREISHGLGYEADVSDLPLPGPPDAGTADNSTVPTLLAASG